MTLIELSNIFNQVAGMMPELNNYHFGLLSDIDIVIKNNFNPSAKCNTPYPLLLMEPPTGSYNVRKGQTTRTIKLWVVDRQQADKNGTTCETLVEKMSFIEGIGNSFLRTLKYLKFANNTCLDFTLKDTANFELDSYQFKDRLVTYEMTLDIAAPYNTECLSGLVINNVLPTDREKESPSNLLRNEYSMLYDGVAEYAEAPANPSLTFGNGVSDDPLTISFWLYAGPPTGTFRFILNRRADLLTQGEYLVALDPNNKLQFSMFSLGTSNRLGVVSVPALTNNQWVNVVVTYDGSSTSNGIKIYFNGIEQATTDNNFGTYTAMGFTNSPLVIAKAGWTSAFYYNGYIEELSFIRAELSSTQVEEGIYNNGIPTDLSFNEEAANLNFWSRMGDNDIWTGANWQLLDNSTNTNTLTTVNMEETDRTTNIPL